ncbi:TadE/TadG family type IV pilus assembly protein [Ruegeria arenilitoris]|uniref:TadE/TadG family type IV pilus assembly protein n=1 Tax=Ruegeria arenilitoris TaxID=1173585 RepID=UPI00147C2CE0|nr:Tad domain-containing protein [Ruegeria arenilitoris]
MTKNVFKSGTTIVNRTVSPIQRFVRNEDGGAFTIFVLLGFITIFALTGFGVDIMNYERDRANLQSTLDRAVLAAADLDQTKTPDEVVNSYLDLADLSDKLTKPVEVTESFGYRKVTATAETEVATSYMNLAGVDSFTAKALSTAEESIGAVEISLILDMSGSMQSHSPTGGKTKLELLQDAATKFVTLMLSSSDEDKQNISISIIPYATQVNAGEGLLKNFTNVTAEHNYSHCVNFIAEQFSDADIHRGDTLERTGHFDPFSYSEGTIDTPVCPVRAGSAITPVTDDLDFLKAQIKALTASGNTSIDIGMKWGTALLDPSMRGIVGDMATDDYIVPDHFADRPSDYGSDILKIAIVMTDGQNTDQYMLNPSIRDGWSDVWHNPESGASYSWTEYFYELVNGYWELRNTTETTYGDYSTYHSNGTPKHFAWSQRGEWADHPYGNPEPENEWNDEPGTSVRLKNTELLNRASLQYIADVVFGWQPSAPAEWTSKAYSKVETSAKNQRTKHVCGAAKDQGIIVYGIAFEAPRSGYKTIKGCASSDSHVYDVHGLNLEDAFASIASSIRKLRLTQ